jgi:hypothetical protein
VLRELLTAELGWTAAEEPSLTLVARRRRYRLTTLARLHGWVVRLCDRPGYPALAGYPARREVHALAASLPGTALTVFIDAASTEEVWCWTEPSDGGVVRHHEAFRPAADPAPAVAFAPGVRSEAGTEHGEPLWEEGAEAARYALLHRLGRWEPQLRDGIGRRRRGRSSAELLIALVEASRTPEVVRGVWRQLERLRVLDPACGSGLWLLGCLEALAGVGMTCVGRMRGWVEDQRLANRKARPEKLSDFRAIVARVDDLARDGHRDRFVAETVLLHCLHGIERDRSLADQCRARLAARMAGPGTPSGGHGFEDTFVDVRIGDACQGISSVEELAALSMANGVIAALARSTAEEAEALSRAEEQLRRIRLRHGGSAEELANGGDAIRRRRALLASKLAPHLADGAGAQTLHPWIEYHTILQGGGFDLVREHLARQVG